MGTGYYLWIQNRHTFLNQIHTLLKTLILFVLLFRLITPVSGQNVQIADTVFIKRFYAEREHNHKTTLPNRTNALKMPLAFYKKVLSEQLSANCEFEPSCSSFSWYAMEEFGFLKALLLTADRLTRCNGNAQSETFPYLIKSDDTKILDYPHQYRITK